MGLADTSEHARRRRPQLPCPCQHVICGLTNPDIRQALRLPHLTSIFDPNRGAAKSRNISLNRRMFTNSCKHSALAPIAQTKHGLVAESVALQRRNVPFSFDCGVADSDISLRNPGKPGRKEPFATSTNLEIS